VTDDQSRRKIDGKAQVAIMVLLATCSVILDAILAADGTSKIERLDDDGKALP